MDILEALQEERRKHPNAQILIGAMSDWRHDGEMTLWRDWYIDYEPFLYWEGDVFYDDYDECAEDLMDRLDLTREEADEYIERNGYEDAIVVYAR